MPVKVFSSTKRFHNMGANKKKSSNMWILITV